MASTMTCSVLCRSAACACAAVLLAAAALGAQSPPETVGQIEGEDIAVRGQVTHIRQDGRSITVLASGSEVTVRSGVARIALEGGGELTICGPAQLSLLKSGGALTLALNSGRVRARIESAAPLGFFSPLLVATPVAIAGAPRESVFGLETGGACVHAARGAVRLEHQLTGQSLVVPERAEVYLPGGELEALREAAGACRCELPVVAQAAPPAPPPRQPEIAIAAAKPANNEKPEEKPEPPKTPPREEPVWRVVMPPLSFDAFSPEPPPEPSADTILLVREVRLRPAVIFRGRVEPPPPKPAHIASAPKPGATEAVSREKAAEMKTSPAPSPPAPERKAEPAREEPARKAAAEPRRTPPRAEPAGKKEGGGLFSAVKGFFGRLFGRKPKPREESP